MRQRTASQRHGTELHTPPLVSVPTLTGPHHCSRRCLPVQDLAHPSKQRHATAASQRPTRHQVTRQQDHHHHQPLQQEQPQAARTPAPQPRRLLQNADAHSSAWGCRPQMRVVWQLLLASCTCCCPHSHLLLCQQKRWRQTPLLLQDVWHTGPHVLPDAVKTTSLRCCFGCSCRCRGCCAGSCCSRQSAPAHHCCRCSRAKMAQSSCARCAGRWVSCSCQRLMKHHVTHTHGAAAAAASAPAVAAAAARQAPWQLQWQASPAVSWGWRPAAAALQPQGVRLGAGCLRQPQLRPAHQQPQLQLLIDTPAATWGAGQHHTSRTHAEAPAQQHCCCCSQQQQRTPAQPLAAGRRPRRRCLLRTLC